MERTAVAELARIVVRAALPDRPDASSVESLSEIAGLTRRVFQLRCQAAGMTARNCVHFVQCMRAVLAPDVNEWDPSALISVSDPRTLRKLMHLAGFSRERRPNLTEFVLTQQFCAAP